MNSLKVRCWTLTESSKILFRSDHITFNLYGHLKVIIPTFYPPFNAALNSNFPKELKIVTSE